jgi:hypothetical protein
VKATPSTKFALAILVLLAFSCLNSKPGEDEYRQFGVRIVKYLQKKDYERLENLYSPDSSYNRVLELARVSKTNLSEDNSRLIKIQLYEHFTRHLKHQSSGAAVSFFVSRTYVKDNTPHVVVTIDQEGKFNFIDFELGAADKIRISDFYDYEICDSFSNNFTNTELVKLTGIGFGSGGYKRALTELGSAQSYATANDYRRAWITFNKIEYRYQGERTFQATKLTITKELSDSLYLRSLAALIGTFRNDDRLRISRSFEFYKRSGYTREAATTLDSLAALVGESPVIQRLRSDLN